jgi:hypothetical protein
MSGYWGHLDGDLIVVVSGSAKGSVGVITDASQAPIEITVALHDGFVSTETFRLEPDQLHVMWRAS